ncbi:Capsular polysaccharide synthesis, CpsB/CapC [Candidatus Magnetomorum sp. HK-1]|nr:Capsular polysaccharide synthesis, CpsB/CapC [Candidatus Magnetomorum sp. HK-1]
MIDIHCHILPFIDDGPANINDSIEMLHCAEKDGIQTIVATPHSFDGVYLCTSEMIHQSIERLQNEIEKHNLSVTILPGMEVHICEQLHQKIIAKKAISLNNTRYILLELPGPFVPPHFKEVIFQLRLKGYYPILAHPERNFVVQNDPDIIYDFIEWGIFIQLTAASVTGFFGTQIKRLCKKMLLNRQVHFLASDAHSPGNRPPILSEAFQKAVHISKDENYARTLIDINPKNVIADAPLDICEPRRKKRFFSFLN